jgi:hypothetical protein
MNTLRFDALLAIMACLHARRWQKAGLIRVGSHQLTFGIIQGLYPERVVVTPAVTPVLAPVGP